MSTPTPNLTGPLSSPVAVSPAARASIRFNRFRNGDMEAIEQSRVNTMILGGRLGMAIRYSWLACLLFLVVAIQCGVFSPEHPAIRSQTTPPVSNENFIPTVSIDMAVPMTTLWLKRYWLQTVYGTGDLFDVTEISDRCSTCCKKSRRLSIHFNRLPKQAPWRGPSA
jgi:hypothetical protein